MDQQLDINLHWVDQGKEANLWDQAETRQADMLVASHHPRVALHPKRLCLVCILYGAVLLAILRVEIHGSLHPLETSLVVLVHSL
jgi:hypothetical protein